MSDPRAGKVRNSHGLFKNAANFDTGQRISDLVFKTQEESGKEGEEENRG